MRLFFLQALLVSTIVMPSESFAEAPFFDPEGKVLADDYTSYRGGCVPEKINDKVNYYYIDEELSHVVNRDVLSKEFLKLINDDENKEHLYPIDASAIELINLQRLAKLLESLEDSSRTLILINATIFSSKLLDHFSAPLELGDMIKSWGALLDFVGNGIPYKRNNPFNNIRIPRNTEKGFLSCSAFFVKRRIPVECYMEAYTFTSRNNNRKSTRLVIVHTSMNGLLDWSRVTDQNNLYSDKEPLKEPLLEILGTPEQVARNMQWCITNWLRVFTPLTGLTEGSY